MAEWLIAPGCNPGVPGTSEVRILLGALMSSSLVAKAIVLYTIERRFESDLLNKDMCLFHKYQIKKTQPGTGSSIDSLTLKESKGILVTAILYKCKKCGKIKTDIVRGHWEKNETIKL